MRSFKDFQAFVNANLMPMLKALEQERLFIKKMYLIPRFFASIGALLFLVAIHFFREQWWLLAMAALTSPVLPYYFIEETENKLEEFRSRYKELIIIPMLNFISPELKYNPDGRILLKHFVSSSIFTRFPERYYGEDLIHGKIGNTYFAFSEVHAEYKTEYYDTNLKKQTLWHTIFKGLFFIANFNKSFEGKTLILPDKTERLLGPLLSDSIQTSSKRQKQLIKLEHPDFEKEFVVYGDDQLESRYILSPEIVERILEFKRKAQAPVYFSFAENSMFVGLSKKVNYFEPSYRHSIINIDSINELYSLIYLITDIVDDFNLNARIWK